MGEHYIMQMNTWSITYVFHPSVKHARPQLPNSPTSPPPQPLLCSHATPFAETELSSAETETPFLLCCFAFPPILTWLILKSCGDNWDLTCPVGTVGEGNHFMGLARNFAWHCSHWVLG